MEEVQIASNLENEREGRDVKVGVKGSNSNGHGKELDKEGHMMKIIERLQKDSQAHRDDNRRLKKAPDKQGEFNLKLLRSLDRIEKKLEKESDIRKIGSCRTPERKIKSTSVSGHRRRSPKNSGKEAHSSSSPSPTRKHRRYGVDELKGEMNKIKPSTFDGEHKKEEDVETWLLGMRKYFQL
jgi:hypothetical protein